MDVEPQLLSEANPDDADSLVSTNEPDDLHNEQTWPTEEEMQGDEATGEETSLPSASAGTTPKAVRRIPKGMSEYQASWIVEEEDSGSESSADGEGSIADEVEEMEDMVVEADAEMDYDSKSVGFEDLDDEVEAEEQVFGSIYRHQLTVLLGFGSGKIGNGKSKPTKLSQMKLILHKTLRPERDFNVIVACDHSAQVHGIPLKTCPGIMHAFSSSKTIVERSVVSGDELNLISAPSRYIFHVCHETV